MGGIPNPCGLCNGNSGAIVQWEQVVDGATAIGDFTTVMGAPGDSVWAYGAGTLSRTNHDTALAMRTLPVPILEGPAIIECEVAYQPLAENEYWLAMIGLITQAPANDNSSFYYAASRTFGIIFDTGAPGTFSLYGSQETGAAETRWQPTDGPICRPIPDIAPNEYHKLRMVYFGRGIDCYHNGEFVGTLAVGDGPPECLAFYAANLATFRNIKAWQATSAWKNLPA